MTAEIHRITLGVSNCYLIRDQGLMLVECGSKPKAESFFTELKSKAVAPDQIGLIFVTHGHWDHVSGARVIRKATGAPLAINHREVSWIETAASPLPAGIGLWGRFFRQMMVFSAPLTRFPATTVDIPLEDEDRSLSDFGINGTLLHTPGHTAGSMSLLLDSGDAFVGDLAMNGFPMRQGPGMPIFADHPEQLKSSWRLLIERGARKIYPVHGEPFSVEVLKTLL